LQFPFRPKEAVMNPIKSRPFRSQARDMAWILFWTLLVVGAGAMLYGRAYREAYAETIASPHAWCEARGLRYQAPRTRYGAQLCVDGNGLASRPFGLREDI
jgi:hypothetical protein